MLLVKENSAPITEFYKESPRVEIRYAENGKDVKASTPFYQNDPESNRAIAGYRKGPKNSYTRELAKQYPLAGK